MLTGAHDGKCRRLRVPRPHPARYRPRAGSQRDWQTSWVDGGHAPRPGEAPQMLTVGSSPSVCQRMSVTSTASSASPCAERVGAAVDLDQQRASLDEDEDGRVAERQRGVAAAPGSATTEATRSRIAGWCSSCAPAVSESTVAVADVQALLALQQLVQRQPQRVDEPREDRQRRNVRARARSRTGTRPTRPPPPPTSASVRPCDSRRSRSRAPSRRARSSAGSGARAQMIGGLTSHTVSSGASEVTRSMCSWWEE